MRLADVELVVDGARTAMQLGGARLSDRPAGVRLAADVDELRAAIRRRRKVSFTYTKDTGDVTTRTVRPIELALEGRHWQLAAYCELRQAFRTFLLHRMSGTQVLDSTFEQLRAPPAGERVVARFRTLRFGEDLEAEADRRCAGLSIPDGWVLGKPFRTLATGKIFCRWTGKQRGQDITAEDLAAAVAVFESGEGIGVDKDHDVAKPDGTVVAMWVVDDGDRQSLAVVPIYGPRMAAYVADSSGSLYSSPEVIWTTVHDPRTGEPVGGMRVHTLAITADPAQAHRVLDRVRLTDDTARHRPPEDKESLATPATPSQTQETDVDPETKEYLDKIAAAQQALLEGQQALTQRVEKIEKAGGGGAPPKPDNEQMGGGAADEKFRSLEAEVARLNAARDVDAREKLFGEFSDRVTPAMRPGFDKTWAKGGAELCREVYSAMPKATPTIKGHGQPVATTGASLDEQRDAAIRERMAADKTPYHTAALALRRENHALFVPGGAR
ncbi:MAG: WYL domain-containing protein [Myxococcales bacterium]|nr:WYL domain-containing protein [Myxococcales bacterium]